MLCENIQGFTFVTFKMSQFKSSALVSMDFVASKYCIKQENPWIPRDCF